MENTIKNKALFFAENLGSLVEINPSSFTTAGVNDIIIDTLTSVKISGNIETFNHVPPIADVKLLKKHYYHTSNKQDLAVAKIFYPAEENWSAAMRTANIGRELIEKTIVADEDSFSVFGINNPADKIIEAIDFLRSERIALRWRNLPVEKQIEYGWIKME